MRQIILCVLSLSLSGALTGLILLLIRPFTKKAFSKRWNYYVWLLVVLRLLLPVHFDIFGQSQSAAAVGNQISDYRAEETEAENVMPENVTAEDVAKEDVMTNGVMPEDVHSGVSGAEASLAEINSVLSGGKSAVDMGMAAGIVWIFGGVIILAKKLWNYRHFTDSIRGGSTQISENEETGLTAEMAQKLHIKRAPALYESASVSSPLTIGLWKPVIVLPEGDRELSQMKMVIHHELIHIKRKDLWYKWLYQILLCIHWFNPVLYLIVRKLNIDCELSCDEAVLTSLTKEGRTAYGNILINAAEQNIAFGSNVPSTTLLERKEDLKERLKGILQYKKQNGFKILLSISAFMGISFLSACGSIETSPDAMPVQVSGESLAERYTSFVDEAAGKYEDYWDGLNLNILEKAFWEADLDNWLKKSIKKMDKNGEAWQVYNDDKKLAGEDIYDWWSAFSYQGSDKIRCSGLLFNGADSLLIVNTSKETDIQVETSFELLEGQFKIVCIAPDGSISLVNDTGAKTRMEVSLQKGRNVIKMVGQGAKLKELKVDYSGLGNSAVESIYYSEQDEYSAHVAEAFETGEHVDKDKVMDALPYMEDEAASRALAALLGQGDTLSEEELCDFFIYSDEGLSGHYLTKAIADGQTEPPDAETLSELMPYLEEETRAELIIDMKDKLTFEMLNEWAPYLNDDSLEKCLISWLEEGNTLTYSQFDEISPYLNQSIIEKLDKYKTD